MALIELIADPRTDRYRITCQVRNPRAEIVGGAGVYVAGQTLSAQGSDFIYFTALAYNDARRPLTGPVVINGHTVPTHPNQVTLTPYLYSESAGPEVIAYPTRVRAGPEFLPAAGRGAGWRDVVVTVSPRGIDASWDGQSFGMTADENRLWLKERLHERRTLPPGEAVWRAMRPDYTPRGSFGLYVADGTASFRSVTVTPLPATD